GSKRPGGHAGDGGAHPGDLSVCPGLLVPRDRTRAVPRRARPLQPRAGGLCRPGVGWRGEVDRHAAVMEGTAAMVSGNWVQWTPCRGANTIRSARSLGVVNDMAAHSAQGRAAGILAAASLAAACLLLPGAGHAQLDKVKATMAALIEETRKLGTPHVKGAYPVGGKSAPGLYFGRTRMNNSFDLVDALAKERGGVVILFVKAGNEFVRVA